MTAKCNMGLIVRLRVRAPPEAPIDKGYRKKNFDGNKKRGQNPPGKQRSSNHEKSTPPKFDGECFYCHKKGHRIDECRKKKASDAKREAANKGSKKDYRRTNGNASDSDAWTLLRAREVERCPVAFLGLMLFTRFHMSPGKESEQFLNCAVSFPSFKQRADWYRIPLFTTPQTGFCRLQYATLNQHNKHRRPAAFNVGERVWVSTKYFRPSFFRQKGSAKLRAPWAGPFPVVEIVSTNA
ncbi:hypothetical protein B9479_005326, partial [Cryptococcus floricola]